MIREIEEIRDKVKGFTGVISDLGGPTANMYRIGCKSPEIEAACRKPSCVYPGICSNLNTDHSALIKMYRRARGAQGHQEDPDRLRPALRPGGAEPRVRQGTGAAPRGRLPEDRARAHRVRPADQDDEARHRQLRRFKQMFEKYSAEAGKKQYLIPYFIAAHPGTSDEDMMNLAVWLKKNGFRADQVQTFYPSPMATATAMYHSGATRCAW
jgi:radical SAM superfamily enzyme YgiQ (UPF0313 family)